MRLAAAPSRSRLDDRDAARDRRFVFERRALDFGEPGEFEAVVREHRLVRRDERFAGVERFARQGQRRAVGTADQLDHDIDIIARRQLRRIIDPGEPRQIDAALARAVARADGDNFNRPVGAALDQRGIGIENLDDAAADGAKAGEADAERLGHAPVAPLAGVLTPMLCR
jgi:hypothetical protein